jgi:hypothetical protein
MPDVKAHLTKAILKSGASDDGKYGLLGFLREQQDSIGQDDIWIGVPVELLPHLAVASIAAIPQPGKKPVKGERPVFEIDDIQLGSGAEGQLVLTTIFPQGASISVRLEEAEARTLVQRLELLLAKSAPQKGKKPN